ncbi:hypothetical protein [Niabella hibiscisoli]|uniref:hypothetical protein n=1 Tax=Niabella hibiscisoli TaxID=1825928 RepID=UPI001F0FA0B1|nr:hypothetical protein [Niabella hibiscisoli]MCH5719200.1 hypothetical protein [Niabella hibiscisoli]
MGAERGAALHPGGAFCMESDAIIPSGYQQKIIATAACISASIQHVRTITRIIIERCGGIEIAGGKPGWLSEDRSIDFCRVYAQSKPVLTSFALLQL